jgi:hypothetical protein
LVDSTTSIDNRQLVKRRPNTAKERDTILVRPVPTKQHQTRDWSRLGVQLTTADRSTYLTRECISHGSRSSIRLSTMGNATTAAFERIGPQSRPVLDAPKDNLLGQTLMIADGLAEATALAAGLKLGLAHKPPSTVNQEGPIRSACIRIAQI